MRSRISSSASIAIIVLTTFGLFVCKADAQSGRRRTRYPESEQPASPTPSVSVPQTTSVVKQEQHGAVSRFVLQDGITVVVNEVHAYPIAASVAYLKGALPATGDLVAARVLQELMLDGGTAANSGRAFVTKIEDAGGAVRSDSTIEGSYFSARVPSAQIKQTVALQADLIQNPALPLSELGASIEAAQANELGCCHDAARYAEERAAKMSLGIGATDGVYQQASLERLKALYASLYRPQNLIVVVTGDVTTFDVLVQIEQLYGQFGVSAPAPEASQPDAQNPAKPSRPTPSGVTGSGAGGAGEDSSRAATTATAEARGTASTPGVQEHAGSVRPQAEGQAVIPGGPSVNYSSGRGGIHQTIVSAGYRTGGLGSPDWAAIQVLADLIAQGSGDQGIARAVTSDYMLMPESGVVAVQMRLAPESIDKAEAELFKLVDRLILQPAAAGDLAEAKSLAEHTFYDRVATYDDRALFYAKAEAGGRPTLILAEYAELIRAVTAADIQRAARQYLSMENTAVFEYEPTSAPARTFNEYSYARTVEAWAPGLEQSSPKTPPVKPLPFKKLPEADAVAMSATQSIQPLPVKDFSTLNGPRAYVREDHSLPIVTIGLLFQGGRLTENTSNSGITELMLRSMLSGTKRLNSSQLSSRLAELGAEVTVVCRPDYYGFLITALSANSEKTLKVMHDVVEDPALADIDIEAARRQQIGAISDSRDYGPDRVLDLLLATMYPGHPYGLPAHGTEQSIGALKADQVREWYQKTIQVQYPLVVVVGDTQGSELISEEIAGGFSRRTVAKSIEALVPKQASSGQKVEPTSCERTLIGIGFPGPKAGSPDLPASEVLASSISSSQTGGTVVYDDADSLNLDPMMVAGAIYMIESAGSKRLPEVKTAFLNRLRVLAERGITDAELKTSRDKAAAQRVSRLYSERDLTFEYAQTLFSGKQGSSVEGYAELLSKVTPADVKRVAAAYLKPDMASIAVLLEVQRNITTQAPKQ